MTLRLKSTLTLVLSLWCAACGDDGSTVNPGAGGNNGSGGANSAEPITKDPSAYTHNSAGAKYPFPQNKALGTCKFPAYNTDTVATAYTNWKSKFFKTNRVIRPENGNDTVSEGIAYGMLIGVYMNDKPMFDALWAYAQSKFNSHGLMAWRQNASGSTVDQGAAIDADEDMAWALLMASEQWGGTYKADATKLIGNIFQYGVESGGVLKPGDNWGGSSQTNPSYFAPAYYRVFAKVGGQNWNSVIETSYAILAKASGQYGLVPNWTNAQGQGITGPGNDANGVHFGYDASRTPWRIALDYCMNGEPRAKAYLEKIAKFYSDKAPSVVGTLKDGYTVNGENPPGDLGDYGAGMAFSGPGGTAAMIGGFDNLLGIVYIHLENATTKPARVADAGAFNYYHASWGVLSLMTMSGNFWNMMP